MKKIEPVELYKEAVTLREEMLGTFARLSDLERQLYETMTTGVSLSDVVRVNPNATLQDAVKLTYERIKSIYEKMEKEVEKTENPDVKSLAKRYLSGIKAITMPYEMALLSIHQNIILLKMAPLQKELAEYGKELEESKAEKKYWEERAD
jgi:hypothetical protein